MAGCSLAGTEAEGDVVAGVDLDLLFAPPARAEINSVVADWQVRAVESGEFGIVREDVLRLEDWTGALRVVWHRVDGLTHYGVVIAPEGMEDVPVLIYLHGDDDGIALEEVLAVYALAPEIRDNFVLVVPSFRSEPLIVEGQVYRSDGPPSPFDRDVDDTIALLNLALGITASASADRISVLGFSRGSAVGLLAAARDPRIDGVAEFFGPTDFLSANARELFRSALSGDVADHLPGIGYLNGTLVEPLKNGDIEIADVRLELIRRSPVYFADRLPAVQIHHGGLDEIVLPSESETLAAALAAAGHPDFEYFPYPGGLHNPLTLGGSISRTVEFLLRIAGVTVVS